MYSPERLNVLLSRARDALIMIGNAETFSGSRRGKDLWTSLFKMLRNDGHMYDGLPAKCERHPDRHQLLKQPDDFLEHCPEGGCTEPWYVASPYSPHRDCLKLFTVARCLAAKFIHARRSAISCTIIRR